jgi:hypothetical protein
MATNPIEAFRKLQVAKKENGESSPTSSPNSSISNLMQQDGSSSPTTAKKFAPDLREKSLAMYKSISSIPGEHFHYLTHQIC